MTIKLSQLKIKQLRSKNKRTLGAHPHMTSDFRVGRLEKVCKYLKLVKGWKSSDEVGRYLYKLWLFQQLLSICLRQTTTDIKIARLWGCSYLAGGSLKLWKVLDFWQYLTNFLNFSSTSALFYTISYKKLLCVLQRSSNVSSYYVSLQLQQTCETLCVIHFISPALVVWYYCILAFSGQ